MTHNIKKRNIKKAIAAFAISGAILAAAHAPRFYQPDEISTDLFLSSNRPIVEITTGTVCNAETGDGEIQNTTETEYNYISYKDVDGIENGSKVLTFFYYSKNAKDVDDITARFDIVYSR